MIRLGQLLNKHRLRKNLTLEDAEKATKIKASFLESIEKGEYSSLPSPTYAKGFVINYATYLGLSKGEAVALFKREFDEKRAYKVLPDSLTNRPNFLPWKIKIQESLLLIAGLIILFLGYLFFQYRSAFFAPSLSISSPKEGSMVSKNVLVTGKTDSNATVLVNNEAVALDNKGVFIKRLELFPGKTTITIVSKSRFGKETKLTREIVVN